MSSPAYAICAEARARAALTQRELASRAGVSPSTVARIERGRMEPTLDLLLRLVRACNLDLRATLDRAPSDAIDAAAAASLTVDERIRQLRNLHRFAHEARSTLTPVANA